MDHQLTYNTLEKLTLPRPVDRIGYISEACRSKTVLDIGCYDETALVKRDTKHWLHGRIAAVATKVIGIDNSADLPKNGLITSPNSTIYKANGVNPEIELAKDEMIDIIVAGEFIEHITAPLDFFRNMKARFPGAELLISTPNGCTFANTLLGVLDREVQHPDHVQVFTFKILNTLCMRAGFSEWKILPYRFYATEMILNSSGSKKIAALTAQSLIRCVERMFPLLSFGYIVRARL